MPVKGFIFSEAAGFRSAALPRICYFGSFLVKLQVLGLQRCRGYATFYAFFKDLLQLTLKVQSCKLKKQ